MYPILDQRRARMLVGLASATAMSLGLTAHAGAAVPASPDLSATTPLRTALAPSTAALASLTPAAVPLVLTPAGAVGVHPVAQLNFALPTTPMFGTDVTRAAIVRTAAETLADHDQFLVSEMIAAGNKIATLPYIWGGGHGSWISPGYDCSGSVSFVLHAAGLLSTPEDSSQLMSYGVPGPGKYVTIYTNPTHAWMTIDGRRFDTIALQETGTRWSNTMMPTDGYTVVHPAGL